MRRGSGNKLRGAVTAAVLTAAATVTALVLPATATAQPARPAAAVAPAAPAAPAWAPEQSAAIHPGVLTTTTGGGQCTSNFVFTAGGRTYLGQAAHCSATGKATDTDGCTSTLLPLGTEVDITGATRKGVLAYSSWSAMQARGETDRGACGANDFALVAIDPADVASVNPTMPFFGGPTGVSSAGLPEGAQTFTYGNSPLRGGISALSPKGGVSAGDTNGGWGHEVYTTSPGVPGDSGSGYLDANGGAVAVLSTLNLAPLPVSNGVADLARALAYANEYGGLGPIALVPGTRAFTQSPPGVPATAVAVPAGPPLGG
ncbi:serine protease [Pseudonocardia dioxanivorans]|uniref:serine protease n=1 Tax=Pseudonocardia dioxanivorans TaxID=240495 RepID=UPI000CD315D8|nr:serine protease [Pseudonocardia dioxanivorans]